MGEGREQRGSDKDRRRGREPKDGAAEEVGKVGTVNGRKAQSD